MSTKPMIPDITLPVGNAVVNTGAHTPVTASEVVNSHLTELERVGALAEIARYNAIKVLCDELAKIVPTSSGNLLVIAAFSNAIGAIK
jgi:hypothetical protein